VAKDDIRKLTQTNNIKLVMTTELDDNSISEFIADFYINQKSTSVHIKTNKLFPVNVNKTNCQ